MIHESGQLSHHATYTMMLNDMSAISLVSPCIAIALDRLIVHEQPSHLTGSPLITAGRQAR
jgi:hypothetical protein